MFFMERFEELLQTWNKGIVQEGFEPVQFQWDERKWMLFRITRTMEQIKNRELKELGSLLIARLLGNAKYATTANTMYQECLQMESFAKSDVLRLSLLQFYTRFLLIQKETAQAGMVLDQLKQCGDNIGISGIDLIVEHTFTNAVEYVQNGKFSEAAFTQLQQELSAYHSVTARQIKMFIEELWGDAAQGYKDAEEAMQHYTAAKTAAIVLKDLDVMSRISLKLSQCYGASKNKRLAMDLFKRHYHEKQMVMQTDFYGVSQILLNKFNLEADDASILEMPNQNSHLDSFAYMDYLTNLKNGLWFGEQLARLQHNQQLDAKTMLLIDVDDFEHYNVNYGYFLGDQAMADLGRALRLRLSGNAMIARIAGDRFGVLVDREGEIEPVIVAKQLLAAVRREDIEHRKPNKKKLLSVSIAVVEGQRKTVAQLEEACEKTIRIAKSKGKDRIATEKGGIEA